MQGSRRRNMRCETTWQQIDGGLDTVAAGLVLFLPRPLVGTSCVAWAEGRFARFCSKNSRCLRASSLLFSYTGLRILSASFGYSRPPNQTLFHPTPVFPFLALCFPRAHPTDLRVYEHTEREQEALRAALDAQRADHERQLEAELAARDAEALEALRLLDAKHRRGDFGRHTAVDAVNGGGGGGHGDSDSTSPPSITASASVPARNRQREASTKPVAGAAGAVVAAIRSAAAARTEALRGATEESHRLEEAMSPSPSPIRGDPGRWYVAPPPRPVPKKTGMLVTGDGNGDGSNSFGLSHDDGGGDRYLHQQHGGEVASAPGGSGTPRSGRRRRRREASAGAESIAAAPVVVLSPPSFPGVAAAAAAPAWTVGDGGGGGDDLAAVLRVSADAGGGGGGGSGGEIGHREPETGGADDADPGLTVRRVCVGRHPLRP